MKTYVAVFALVILACALLTAETVPKVIPPDSVAYGKTYSEWVAVWNQWSLSMPSTQHPLFDTADCSAGQSGPVWFLGGKYCSIDNPNCGTVDVVRSCTVPAGKALFMPILDSEYSVLEMNDPTVQIGELRKLAANAIDDTTNVRFSIDGVSIPHLKEQYRIQSPAFGFTLPENNNLFNAVGEGPYSGGTYFPGVDDGVYVMLAPLPPGPHTIRFHGYFPTWNFTLDITYLLNVKK